MSRWEVFKQDTEGKPHQAVGSLHATDAQHALINAAHVFARRPSALSLWVVPEAAVYSRTAEQLAVAQGSDDHADVANDAHDVEDFHVFRKTSHRRSMTFVDHVGTVSASSPAAALAAFHAAESLAGNDVAALAWWVVPVSRVTASAPEDAPAWFDPAKEKTYKQQSQYGTGPVAQGRR